MQRKDYIFWVALPPTMDDLGLLEKARGLAEPLLDLRYGSTNYKGSILQKAIQQGLLGLTVFADSRDEDLNSFLLKALPGCSRIILTSVRQYGANIEALLNECKKRDIVAGVEVDKKKDAKHAVATGADFLVASGNEAYGLVSEKTSLILIQELLEGLDIPLVIRGSLGPQGAAGALAAGCSGCILDSQLLLLNDSPLSDELKKDLWDVSPCDTTVVGTFVNRPYRFLCKGSHDEYRVLAEEEKKIFLQNISLAEKIRAFEGVLSSYTLNGFGKEAKILPVGQGIVFSQQFAEKGLGVKKVLKIYRSALDDSIARVKTEFPFLSNSPLAQYHKVKYPLVQGPMACVTDNPLLAVEVAKAGALPFVAVAGLSPQETHRLLSETRSALGSRPFGVGIINFTSSEKIREQIDVLLAAPPDFVTIAGGDSGLVRRFEQGGIRVYIHAPTSAHLKNFLDDKVSGIILEGREAGGHIGALGSLVLWELGVIEIMGRSADSVSSIRLLLAGGIASARGALAAAVLTSPLLDQGVSIGLQLGTAYLMTDEAVESGAISVRYQKMLLNGDETALTGQTVNLPTRWLLTPALRKIIEAELRLEKQNLSLPERKEQIEELNVNHLRQASSGREERIQNVREQKSSDSDVYMCGQAVSLQNQSCRIVKLHEELTQRAQQLAGFCPMSETAWEVPEDAVAIIGMGCIFPDANNPAEYWKNIIGRHCAIREIPKNLWDPDLYYHPVRTLYKTYSKIGAHIEGFEKNPLKFRIPPVSAPFIERIQFLMLEVVHQALEDAGYLQKEFPRERTAVFVGLGTSRSDLGIGHHVRAHWSKFADSLKSVKEFSELPQDLKDSILDKSERIFNQGMPELSEDSCAGVFGSIVASRICNCFGLGGTSLTMDAACASSLAAVDLGVRGLRERKFDLVLAGAVDDRLDMVSYLLFSSLGALSAKGCFPFDERADGMVLGEGAGVVLLKRLDEAIRDGDKIYAVIRSIGTSSDGRAKGITAPDVNGQMRALERTYAEVPFTPETVSLIEAHGTGTWAGDITEITALTQFVRRYSDKNKFIGLGSVKSMIGHLKSAAGIAGIIKVALALHNQILPPTINCEQPRKEVDWGNSPFYLITESRAWKDGFLPRRAAIDAFGFGGINFHAILEEAPHKEALLSRVASSDKGDAEFPAELFIFRAPTRAELINFVKNTKGELIHAGQADLRKIAICLNETVSSEGPTLAVVANGADELTLHLDKVLKVLSDESRSEFSSAQGIYFSETPLRPGEKVAFLFPGFGSQYLNMGGDLPTYFPFVNEIFRKVDYITHQHIGASILPVLTSGKETSKENNSLLGDLLNRADYLHPAMMALGMGILEVLARAGVRPDMVAGHSLGEYLALYAAGVFDVQTAVDVIVTRGEGIAKHCSQNGAMASIGLSADKLQGILKEAPGFVVVANKNCPAQTVISGDVQAVEYVTARLEKRGILCERLPTAIAHHTPLLANCAKVFYEFLDNIRINPPQMPVQSNLAGRAYKSDAHFASYLRDTLAKHLTQPVEFINNIHSLYENGARLFVEVGPGSTLSSFVDNILVDKPHWTVVTNLAKRPATLQLLHALAFCVARGLPVNLNGIMPMRSRLTLRRTAHAAITRPSTFPLTKESDSPAVPNLIKEALADQDTKIVGDYLKQRINFLKDMLRVDFQHFTGTVVAQPRKKVSASAADDLEKRIVGLISRKTGYPPDVIDIDLDVEAELGLDSIKQVEIMREVALELNINFGEDLKSQRFKITTLRKLIEVCRSLIAQKPVTKKSKPSTQESQVQLPKKDWRTDCYRWVSEKVETPLSGGKNPEALKGSRVLLLAGEEGPGSLLKSSLEQAGAVVSMVLPSHSLESLPEDFNLVLNLWGYAEDETPTLEKAHEWWRQTVQHAEAVLRVGKKLAHSLQRNKNSRALWVEVTSLGGELGSHTIGRVSARAGIGLGIIRCLSREFPDTLESLYLDFDPQEPQARAVECIFNELLHEKTHSEIGYSQDKRFEIRWKIDELSNQESSFPLNTGSVVLAIGGARGITASICRELAGRSRAQFIIVGRSPVPIDDNVQLSEPITFDTARNTLLEQARAQGKRIVPVELDRLVWQQVWKAERAWNINNLRSIATKVVYHQCDITDAESVRQLIHEVWQEYGRIDLVIQGASDLIEKSTLDIDANEFTENMKSKALGTAYLLAALSEVEVGAFINFSSVAGRWGNMGQGSYAAGHEVAAILVAGMRGKRPGKWVNIFFGPWLNVGMIRIGEVMERLRARESDFIIDKMGSEFFIKEFIGGLSHNVAFCGNKSLRISQMPLQRAIARTPPTPLFDRVEIVGPGIAQGRRVFDLKRDRFVADHYVYYDTPILPGVVSLEMIAQTASLLSLPEFSVTDIVDVVFPHPGIFPRGEPREFCARARLLSKEEKGIWFFGEVFSLFTPPGSTQPQEMCHARCRMRFGHRQPPQEPSLLLVSTGIGECRVDAKPLWNTQIRQGRQGMFRSIYSFSSVARDGAAGEILAAHAPEFGKRPCLDNPLRLDGLMDLVNLSTDIFLGNESHLVGGIKSIKFFASDDPEEARFCRARICEVTEVGFIHEVEAMNRAGKVVERVSGIQKPMVSGDAVELSEPIWEFMRENPRQKEIRRLLSCQGKLVLAQVDISLVMGALQADEDRLLHEQLTAEEIKQYHSLKHAKRLREWLAGRIAAKGAVRIYLDKQAPLACAVKIQSKPNRFPYAVAVMNMTEGVLALPYISISHSSDIAVASASQGPGVGIDVEEITESILEISHDFSTDEELERMVACTGFIKLTALAYIWAMKEASFKAIDFENCSMKEIALEKIEEHGEYIVCVFSHSHTSHIKSVAFKSRNYVFAVSASFKKKGAYEQGINR